MLVIAGPCVLDNYQDAFNIARACRNVCYELEIDYVFKASWDKANRTKGSSYRGPGMELGLCWLKLIKDALDVKITTDVHEVWQMGQVAAAADIIQIPAFLCRQTDLVWAAKNTGRVVSVKKGQFLSAADMEHVREKAGLNFWAIERGNSFGYGTLVVDMANIQRMKAFADKVIFDATHSVQVIGGGGSPQDIPILAKSAIAAGADGIFMEVHPNPDQAKCDGANSLALHEFESVIKDVLKVYHAVN